MKNRSGLACLVAVCLTATLAASQILLNPRPLRIVLLLDSSSEVGAMVNQFRAGIKSFIDGLPEDAEVAIISTGGQLRIRQQPTADREKLLKTAGSFAQDGGANAFLDTLLESDQRFLRKATDRRHVFVILSTDNGASRGEQRIDDYNRFVDDFLRRRGHAFGVVIRVGGGMGPTSDIVNNLTQNTGGTYEVINSPNSLADKMKAVAIQVSALP